MRRRAAAALLVPLLLLPACGLPLAQGVRAPGEVPAEESLPEPINVLPPGPQPGATPEEVVFGFLAAQSSSADEHAVARGFLQPDRAGTWDDDAGVTVFDPFTVTASATRSGEEAQVRLDLQVLGRVAADGAATASPATDSFQGYRLRLVSGQWRLVEVPPGLTLSPAARDRVLDPVTVHYLAPAQPGQLHHLVADLVQLQAGDDTPRLLVERLLAGPSSALGASARTAVPAGTRLLSVRASASGEVVVDLSAEVSELADDARRDLSAQLVWTLRNLPGFSRLRLLVEGRPLVVPGAGDPQPRTAWSSYDPDAGTGEGEPSYGVVEGRLLALDPGSQVDPAQPVEGTVLEAAVDPREDRLAVLTDAEAGRVLSTGRLTGPLRTAAQGRLRSPTWGSGQSGVWVLRTGAGPRCSACPRTATRWRCGSTACPSSTRARSCASAATACGSRWSRAGRCGPVGWRPTTRASPCGSSGCARCSRASSTSPGRPAPPWSPWSATTTPPGCRCCASTSTGR